MRREVTAAGELMVEVWDLGGQARGAKQLKKLADNPSEVINKSRFLGRAEIPLVDTLVETQRGRALTLQHIQSCMCAVAMSCCACAAVPVSKHHLLL